MLLSHNERALSESRLRHHLFQAVFVQMTYPSRYVYFRWSRVHTAVETTGVVAVVVFQLEASEIGRIQALDRSSRTQGAIKTGLAPG